MLYHELPIAVFRKIDHSEIAALSAKVERIRNARFLFEVQRQYRIFKEILFHFSFSRKLDFLLFGFTIRKGFPTARLLYSPAELAVNLTGFPRATNPGSAE